MRISTLSISVFSLAVCVDALVQPLLGHRVPPVSAASLGQGLDKRQITIGSEPSPPAQCASTCNPVNNEIGLGCPVTACCTTTFETQYYNCLECVGSALDATNYAAAQINLNTLYMTCVDMGFVLPQLVLPGQTANGSSSSAGSAMTPFPTGSSGMASSSSSTRTLEAAISGRWLGLQAELLVGAAVLLWAAGLW